MNRNRSPVRRSHSPGVVRPPRVDLPAAGVGIASQKPLAELADVISRPLFKLESEAQIEILKQWQSIAHVHSDLDLTPAPWKCQDTDDQIFLDLTYELRPAILISKDNALLQIASRAAQDDILITSDYNAFKF